MDFLIIPLVFLSLVDFYVYSTTVENIKGNASGLLNSTNYIDVSN